jgi:hypothetical protein
VIAVRQKLMIFLPSSQRDSEPETAGIGEAAGAGGANE